LLVGGRTLVVEQEAILDAERFVGKVVEGRVAVLQVVPSYLEVVLSYLEQHPRELSDLRFVSVTGEALKKELAQRWFAAKPEIKLVNAYGLTETSDDTNHEIMERVPDRERVPLGPPIHNVHVYVVDEHLSPVPLGAPGELVFSGVCVGRGYVNDPERAHGRAGKLTLELGHGGYLPASIGEALRELFAGIGGPRVERWAPPRPAGHAARHLQLAALHPEVQHRIRHGGRRRRRHHRCPEGLQRHPWIERMLLVVTPDHLRQPTRFGH